ncbi:MAG: MFS transporter [Deltaproteobacteria bacterium]|nr:MFS transporter [Deltaproteobacteria bacterium]
MRLNEGNIASKHSAAFAVVVAALGYFVDIYDLVLFSIVRVPSLKGLGYSGDELLQVGISLLNAQMIGMLIGGILWGIMGDKKGRVSVLFGSILMYSLANIANGFVQGATSYAVLRFIAGVGLAGELGVSVTLVAESMPKEKRGWGTTIIATVGVMGAVVAGLVVDKFSWRNAYFIGGAMGLLLLVLRYYVIESGMFCKMKETTVSRGNFLYLFSNKERFKRYLNCIVVGVPSWFVVGILVTFSPEITQALGAPELVNAGTAVMYCYAGLVIGDLSSGALSQYVKSRKLPIYLFLTITAISCLVYLNIPHSSALLTYIVCLCMGVGIGYWAVFVMTAAEQFGTNLRATVTTTVPNFVRGAVVLLTSLFQYLRPQYGIITAAYLVGAFCLFSAFYSAYRLNESFHNDLEFVEE